MTPSCMLAGSLRQPTHCRVWDQKIASTESKSPFIPWTGCGLGFFGDDRRLGLFADALRSGFSRSNMICQMACRWWGFWNLGKLSVRRATTRLVKVQERFYLALPFLGASWPFLTNAIACCHHWCHFIFSRPFALLSLSHFLRFHGILLCYCILLRSCSNVHMNNSFCEILR